MSEVFTKGWDGPLPSHLTQAQTARVSGVSNAAVYYRVLSGTLPRVPMAGVMMIPTMAVVESLPTDAAVHFAYAPLAIVELAQRALASPDLDQPMFSARDLLGCYLGLSRMPWPPALP